MFFKISECLEAIHVIPIWVYLAAGNVGPLWQRPLGPMGILSLTFTVWGNLQSVTKKSSNIQNQCNSEAYGVAIASIQVDLGKLLTLQCMYLCRMYVLCIPIPILVHLVTPNVFRSFQLGKGEKFCDLLRIYEL